MDLAGSRTGAEVRLEQFVEVMKEKLKMRSKRPPNPAKWPLDGVDAAGDRDWRRCKLEFLISKLQEELQELLEPGADVELEAADVALVAFMIAEKLGADWDWDNVGRQLRRLADEHP